VLDLSPHGQAEKNQPVNHQDRPEHRDIEDLEPCTEETDDNSSSSRVPKLELRQSPDKRTELLILLSRQSTHSSILHIIIYSLIGRVEFRLEESEEQVEEVDAQRICNNVPSLSYEYPDEE